MCKVHFQAPSLNGNTDHETQVHPTGLKIRCKETGIQNVCPTPFFLTAFSIEVSTARVQTASAGTKTQSNGVLTTHPAYSETDSLAVKLLVGTTAHISAP